MKILVVEDDRDLAKKIAATIRASGMLADVVHEGIEAEYMGDTGTYDAVVLDLGLPGRSGIDVLKGWRMRGNKLPVLILTARSRWPDKREGFNAGADDYLTKPFHMEEVMIRLQALIRRSAGFAAPTLTCGTLNIDMTSGATSFDGRPITLTTQEFRIVEYLLHRKDKIVSRLELIDHVYGTDGDPDSNVIDVLISRIRKKIGNDMLLTVRGRGYRMIEPTTASEQST
jgi:two-component system OmpR family response regulator